MSGLENAHSRYEEAVVIYNPYAGGLVRRGHLLQRIIDQFQQQGVRTRLAPTTGPNMAASLARQAVREGADLIVAAGGDGTINEVVNGLAGSDVPLAILPGGTANVLAHELRMKASTLLAPGALARFTPCKIALGLLRGGEEERYFLSMAGAGLDAQIVYDLNLDLKAAIGKLAYYIGGFGHVFERIPQFTAEIDGKTHPCGFALVSRVRNYGGDLEIARSASLLRDEFEVVLFEGENAFGYLRYLAAVLMGRAQGLKGVSVIRTRRVICECPEDRRIRAQVDGELAWHLPVSMEIVPDALTLLLPEQYVRREQALRQTAVCV